MRKRLASFLKSITKWTIYIDSLFILVLAIRLYHEDTRDEDNYNVTHLGSVPGNHHKMIFLGLNIMIIIESYVHFMCPQAWVIIIVLISIVALFIYRAIMAINFYLTCQIPNLICMLASITWLVADKYSPETSSIIQITSPTSANSPVTSLKGEYSSFKGESTPSSASTSSARP